MVVAKGICTKTGKEIVIMTESILSNKNYLTSKETPEEITEESILYYKPETKEWLRETTLFSRIN